QAPAACAAGASARLTSGGVASRTSDMPLTASGVASSTSRLSSPYSTSSPRERSEPRTVSRSAGKSWSNSPESICRPTTPLAPTTAIRACGFMASPSLLLQPGAGGGPGEGWKLRIALRFGRADVMRLELEERLQCLLRRELGEL